MQVTTALVILVISDLCVAIRVPVDWEQGDHGDSEVHPYGQDQSQEYDKSYSATTQTQIPKEYFVYTAQKPQFAVDIAKFHGVENPEKHYQSYAIRPYTGKLPPELGKHYIFDKKREAFRPFQQYSYQNEALSDALSPVSVDYEVFHPYKAEEPALHDLYKDPVLEKIRDDIRNSQYRLKNYENDAGKSDISEGEYLETPQTTDRKKVPQRNIPVPYEIHRPQRRPAYYKIAPNFNPREQVLNQKFRLPVNQNLAKIKPVHYRPIKNHLQKLRQHHAIKFDDENNEYPQLPHSQQYSDLTDGYDIYERGKEKYSRLRNNVDESINDLVKKHKPAVYQKLELQSNGDRTQNEIRDDSDDDSEFIPIKNYAQVRKIKTMSHLPREAAFADAETFDEMINAPRLREAVKSTKAQTVYTEEGYEDAAYDHAGEQKHAEENEGHGGFLKEKEISGGKYKIPTFSGAYQDAEGNEYRDQVMHGKKWKNNDQDQVKENDADDYAEDETAHSIEANIYDDLNEGRDKRQNNPGSEVENIRKKIEQDYQNNNVSSNKNSKQEEKDQNEAGKHEVIKRETTFKVPEINLNATFLNVGDINKIKKFQIKIQPSKDDLKTKYPYYFQNLGSIHRNSPLRYAENLKLIPRKTEGGTEFYDSRSTFECPEVDDTVDAVPEKLKKNGHPDDDDSENIENNEKKEKLQDEFDKMKEKPRLKGLGDKIDCFKSKYFGENPLDSPFFKEDIIINPEPVTALNLAANKIKSKDIVTSESKTNDIYNITGKLINEAIKPSNISLFDELKTAQLTLQNSLVKTNKDLKSTLLQNTIPISTSPHQIQIYSDILDNIKHIIQKPILQGPSILSNMEKKLSAVNDDKSTTTNNVTYNSYQKQQDVIQPSPFVRKKRATPFAYEPYKIIRDGQVQESKKTLTTNKISPLIKKLQSSQVVDNVLKSSQETEQPSNLHSISKTYKDIGQKERGKSDHQKDSQLKSDPSIIDVNIDQRRGEPRYEIRPANHKVQYTPVESKKAISLVDYQSKTSTKTQKENNSQTSTETISTRIRNRNHQTSKQSSTTIKPYFDVSSYLPNLKNYQKLAASNTVTKVLGAKDKSNKEDVSTPASDSEEDDYEEYDDEQDITTLTTTTTTTSTSKPFFRRKTLVTTTTSNPLVVEEDLELPRLRLITRFRTVSPTPKSLPEDARILNDDDDADSPKYREKKRKSTESTLVTDTKSYNSGNDEADREDEIRKVEIDSMIGIKQDMDDYTPRYEKEIKQNRKNSYHDTTKSKDEDEEEYEEEDEEDDAEDDDDEYDEDEDEDEDAEEESTPEVETTTSEPLKRTLVRTTEAPSTTSEARSEKLQIKPIVTKKKIEIHKELPVNKSSPHRSQFKQDIKEVEIIKEMPQRRPQKNYEALHLYKDDKLAEDVNKLSDVEIFKENLDLKQGPRHGGNYRSVKLTELNDKGSQTLQGKNNKKVTTVEIKDDTSLAPQPRHRNNFKATKEDAETSESETTKLVERGDTQLAKRKHGSNLKLSRDVEKPKNSKPIARLELIDSLDKISSRNMHGGNLKSSSNRDRTRFGSKSEKIVEFDEESEDDDSEPMHGGNFKSYENSRNDDSSFHGGNYRNAKLVIPHASETAKIRNKSKGETNVRSNSAELLNSFAQAVPILTTTPTYILDPSKRMYYYVES